MWEKSGELDWGRVIICDGTVLFELLDALDGQDRRASAQCDDDGVKHGPGEEAEEVPPLDCRFIGLLLDVRIGVQGDARVAALLVAYLIILSVRCETSLSALSDQSMFRNEKKSAKHTFVKKDSACAKRYQYRRVA